MASLIHKETPAELFRGLVAEAVDQQNLNPSRASRRYLVQLLAGFVRPEGLYARVEIEPDRPLAEIFLAAVSSDGMRQFSLLKLSGDLALLVSGVFSDSFKGGPVDVDYYGRLGGSAYATMAVACHAPEGARVFSELAVSFGSFVDVLAEVSEKLRPDRPLGRPASLPAVGPDRQPAVRGRPRPDGRPDRAGIGPGELTRSSSRRPHPDRRSP